VAGLVAVAPVGLNGYKDQLGRITSPVLLEGTTVPLGIPTPDGVLELFRHEIVVREAEIGGKCGEIARAQGRVAWDNPFPGVETLASPGGSRLMRVTFKVLLNNGASNESDRIRHELRRLRNDIRAAIPSESQVEFDSPRMTHVDHPDGIEINCYTYGIVRTP
jgi:hypothetical protein